MPVEHILSQIVDTPLLVTPAKLQAILGVLNPRSSYPVNVSVEQMAAISHMNSVSGQEQLATIRPVNTLEEEDGRDIEVVQLLGSLVSRNGGFSDSSGLRSYRGLEYDIRRALQNTAVGGIILDIDSFGGAAAGCERVARFIAEANVSKPIYAVVDLNGYSAAYEIACACSRVIVTDSTAGVGSIGCIAIHRDQSRADEQDGYNYSVFTFGANKENFSPLRPLRDDESELLQKSVDAHGMAFARLVSEMRGLKLQTVVDMEAACFSGSEAVQAGLADNLASFSEAVAMLADEIETRKKKSFSQKLEGPDMPEAMSTKQRMAALLTADDGPDAIAELGFVKKDEALADVAAALDSGEKSVAGLLEVAEICQLGELTTEETVALLKTRPEPAAARESVQELRAARTRRTTIRSTTTAATGDGVHPLVARCTKLAAAAKK